jgi:hypothetical protein
MINITHWIDSQASMEELDFFDEICLISLYAGKAVRFTAVVDSNGKLILAKFKRSNSRRQLGILPYTSGILDSSEQQQLFLRQSCLLFYHAQLTSTLKNLTSCSAVFHNLLPIKCVPRVINTPTYQLNFGGVK